MRPELFTKGGTYGDRNNSTGSRACRLPVQALRCEQGSYQGQGNPTAIVGCRVCLRDTWDLRRGVRRARAGATDAVSDRPAR